MCTIHLKTKNAIENKVKAKVQSVPFSIEADCDAKVSQYFDKYVKEKSGHLKASFRGYPLMGQTIEVPEGYKGLVLHESMRPATDKEERSVHVSHSFDKITLWNWDKVPDDNDALSLAMDWIDIAEVLHSPILEE